VGGWAIFLDIKNKNRKIYLKNKNVSHTMHHVGQIWKIPGYFLIEPFP